MKITIRLLSIYRRYLPEGHTARGEYTHDVVPGATAADVVAGLPIPRTDGLTILVNGRHAEPDHVLAEGDCLTVFPAVGGG